MARAEFKKGSQNMESEQDGNGEREITAEVSAVMGPSFQEL